MSPALAEALGLACLFVTWHVITLVAVIFSTGRVVKNWPAQPGAVHSAPCSDSYEVK